MILMIISLILVAILMLKMTLVAKHLFRKDLASRVNKIMQIICNIIEIIFVIIQDTAKIAKLTTEVINFCDF